MRILLVDDDLDLLEVLAFALRRDGFDVVEASDGEQARERWQTVRPDVVVLDVRLPGLSGIEVCRLIRSQGLTPVVLMSAADDPEQQIEGLEAGANEYLRKPFSPRQLTERIRRIWQERARSAQP